MDATLLTAFYERRRKTFDAFLSRANKEINFLSNARLLTAGVFITVFYFFFSNTSLVYVLVVLVVIFILLMAKHSKLFDQKTHLENLVRINEHELQSLKGDFSCFKNGIAYVDPAHPYTHDLDIFGNGSLFQYMDRSSTLDGEATLASALSLPLQSTEDIAARQHAVQELSSNPDFRQHFLATGMTIEEFKHDRQQLLDWVSRKSFIYGSPFYRILLWCFPLMTVTLVILSFFTDRVSTFAILCAVIQWFLLGINLKKINAFHQYISRKKNILAKYANLLNLTGKEEFHSSLLRTFHTNAKQASGKVRSLASLVRSLDARLNFLMNIAVNSLLMYDLQCVYRLEKWKEENAQHLETWLNVIRDTDMLCSLGTFSFNNPDFIFPQISTKQKMTAVSLGHPLIAAHERITNDVHIGEEQSILIITGANMAGKSTFLRTLGVNMVLALVGAPVCAKEFHCPIINIRSGMRTADSLQDHQSYFYAELNRLKTIVDDLRSGKSLFILLDEILKGTNSTDKQAGSIALVRQLLSYSCLASIATHDLALGDLEKEYPEQIKNYCFEPTIENDQLSFDYKLKTGLAQKMNATFLMKKMGIIPGDKVRSTRNEE